MFKTRALQRPVAVARPHELTTGEVFREHAPYAWRVLRRLGVAARDVDDVCQEVFVIVHRKLAAFEGRSSVRTWVYGICLRTASDYRKRARRDREVSSNGAPELAVDARQEETTSLRQARAALDAILDHLDDDKRAVFVLYEIEEVAMADVAELVGCPVQTAYSRLHAARRDVEAALRRLRAGGSGASGAATAAASAVGRGTR